MDFESELIRKDFEEELDQGGSTTRSFKIDKELMSPTFDDQMRVTFGMRKGPRS